MDLKSKRTAKAGDKLRPFVWLSLILLGVLAFHNLSDAGFVGDDYDQVLNSPVIREFHPLKFLTGSTFNSGGMEELRGTYYKPAMTAALALVYQAFGDSPRAFHLVQVALGILNSILLLFFLRSFFSWQISWLGAAIFLLHPGNSEAIQYISNYQDVLFMLFGLAALNVERIRSRKNVYWVGAEFILLLLASLSKETGLLFVPLVLVYSWCLHGRLAWWPAGLTVAAYAALRLLVSRVVEVQAHYTPMETADTFTRLLNVPAAVFYYLKTFFFPWPLSLAQHWIYREITLAGFVLPLLAIVAAVTFAVISTRRFGRPALLFFIWSVLAVGLHSQLLPLDCTVADRWFYLPSIGMLGLLLLWVPNTRPAWLLLSLVAAVCLPWTYARNSHWGNEERLLTRDLQYQPESFAIMSQLGFIWLNQNRTEEACSLLRKSVELAPAWWVNTNNYGVCLFRQGRDEEAAAMFVRSMNSGQYHLAYENYAKLLIAQKRYREAGEFLNDAIQRFPGNAVLRNLMATVRDVLN